MKAKLNRLKYVILVVMLMSSSFFINSRPYQEQLGTTNLESSQIDTPRTIDSLTNITGYLTMELNLTYNASYEALSLAIFMLHYEIMDLQGIYRDLEFKYIQINYAKFIPLNCICSI